MFKYFNLIFILYAFIFFAESGETDYQDILHKPGNFSAENFDFISPDFKVNTFNGNLEIDLDLLTIPGRKGFDLEIRLKYNSKNTYLNGPFSPLRAKGMVGRGWTLHFGKLDVVDKEVALENGIITNYGLSKEKYNGAYDTQDVFLTENFDKLYSLGKDVYELVTPGGERYYRFGHIYEDETDPTAYYLNGNYVTHIYNQNQDTIYIDYHQNSYRISTISDILGRKVTFEYYTGDIIENMLYKIHYTGFNGRSSEITFQYNETGEMLSEISRPNGQSTHFYYTNQNRSMNKLVLPTEGEIEFDYINKAFLDHGGPQGSGSHDVHVECVSSVKTDYDCDDIKECKYYDYSCQEEYPYLYQTVITDQAGHEALILHEHINSRNNLKCRSGKIREKHLYQGRIIDGKIVQKEYYVWGSYLIVFREDNETPIFYPVLCQKASVSPDSGFVKLIKYDGVEQPKNSEYQYRIGYNGDYNVDFQDPTVMSFGNKQSVVTKYNISDVRIDISNADFDVLDTLMYDDGRSRKLEEQFAYPASPGDRENNHNGFLDFYGQDGYKYFLDKYFVKQLGYYQKTGEEGSFLLRHYLYDCDLSKEPSQYSGYLKNQHPGLLNYVLTDYSDKSMAGVSDTIFMEYDEYGNLIIYEGEKGQEIEWEYDPAFNYVYPTLEKNSAYGTKCRASYDFNTGQIIWFEDQNQNITHYDYDMMNNITDVRMPGDSQDEPTIKIKYDYKNCKVEQKIKKNDSAYFAPVSFFYNQYGQLTQIQKKTASGECLKKDILYNNRNKKSYESVQYKIPEYGAYIDPDTDVYHYAYFYDAMGRKTKITNPGHSEDQPDQKRIEYDGYRQRHIDENGHDHVERLNTERKTIGKTFFHEQYPMETQFCYNDFGFLESVTDPNAQIGRYTYSGSGELLSRNFPDPGKTEWYYHNDKAAKCKVVKRTDQKLENDDDYDAHEIVYDQLDRMKVHSLVLEEGKEESILIDGFEGGDEIVPYRYHNDRYNCDVIISSESSKFNINAYSIAYGGHYCAFIESLEPGEELLVEYEFEPLINLNDARNITMFVLENANQEDKYSFSLIVKWYDLYMNEYVYTPPSGGPAGVWRDLTVAVPSGSESNFEWEKIVKMSLCFKNPSETSLDHNRVLRMRNQIDGLYPKQTKSFYFDNLTSNGTSEAGKREVYHAFYDQGETGFDSNPVGHLVKEEMYNTTFGDKQLNSKILYDYDDQERICKLHMENKGLPKQFKRSFYPSGKIEKIIYPEGFTVRYEYNELQQLVAVKDENSGNDIVKYSYYDNGLQKMIRYHDGVISDHNYDQYNYYPKGLVKRILMKKYRYVSKGSGNVIDGISTPNPVVLPGGYHSSKTIWKRFYSYDAAGNLLKINESDISGDLLSEFQYDAVNRLSRETHFEPNEMTREYAYDKAGNISKISVYGEGYDYYRENDYTKTNVNRLRISEIRGIHFPETERDYDNISYDEAGNLVYYAWYEDGEQGESFFDYNHLGHLIKINYNCHTDDSFDLICRFCYDYHGNRVFSEINGKKTWYFYIDNTLMAEFGDDGELTYSYIYANGRRIARRDSHGNLEYYRYDHIGNVHFLTDYKGNVICHYDYYAFGEDLLVSGQSDNRFKYSAKRLIDRIGLYYFGARYYDPCLGRWTSVDPLAFEEPSLTPYHYVRNNPLNRIDPNGMTDWDAMLSAGLRMMGGFGAMVAGGTLIEGGLALQPPSLGTSTVMVIVGYNILGHGSSELVLGAMDLKGAWDTPDGMEYTAWKSVLEEMVAEFGGGEAAEKAVTLLADILTGGKNIPKNALNDEWIKMAKESAILTKDLIEYLKAQTKKEEDDEKKKE